MNLENVQFIPKVFDIAIPFAHQPESSYIAGRLFLDRSRYWRVKYSGKVSSKLHNYSHQALSELIEKIEEDRLKMLNKEFAESGI